MDWLVAFKNKTLPGAAASDDLHTGATKNTIIETGGGAYDARGTDVAEIVPFSLSKKVRITTAEMWRELRALVGKRGFLWRGRQVSSGAPVGAVFYLPFNAAGARVNLTANDGTEPTKESGSVVGASSGKFGDGAVSLCEGFTNYITNPSFEINTIGWTARGSATLTQSTAEHYTGNASGKLLSSDTGGLGRCDTSFSVVSGDEVTYSIRIKSTSSQVSIYMTGAISTSSVHHSGSGEWELLTISGTASSDGTVYLNVRDERAASWDAIYIDAAQVTKTAYQLPYRDGDMPGCSWSGTAHNSTTVVTASRLEYSSDVLSADAGTIAAWIKPRFVDTTQRYIARHYDDTNYIFIATYSDASSFRVRVGDTAATRGTVDVGNWQHIALTWNNGTAAFYVNGALSGSTWIYSGSAVSSNPIAIFADESGTNHASGEICGLIIKKDALSADDIAAIYNAGVPLHEARIQRGIDVRCTELASTRSYNDANHTDVTLNFAAIGRAWRSEVRQIANKTLSASGSLTLTNNGNVTAKNLVVRIIAKGVATVTLSMNGFVMTVQASAANDEIVVDCGAHTVRKNGSDDYGNVTLGTTMTTADWLPMEPSDNTLSVSLSGAEVEIIAQWYDTYR